ncbi:MAG: DUF1540 domain-containing protein [Desulfosporosinus sp.]
MSNQVKKMPQPNGGIKCYVNTCHFYGSGDHCHADKIEVQSPNASTSEMTDCATYLSLNVLNY